MSEVESVWVAPGRGRPSRGLFRKVIHFYSLGVARRSFIDCAPVFGRVPHFAVINPPSPLSLSGSSETVSVIAIIYGWW